MPYGKGTYGSKVGRPTKKAKMMGKKKPMKKKPIKKPGYNISRNIGY